MNRKNRITSPGSNDKKGDNRSQMVTQSLRIKSSVKAGDSQEQHNQTIVKRSSAAKSNPV